MEEFHLLACARYIELNPVRAGVVKGPEDWPWSRAESHINMKDDGLIKTKPLVEIVNKPWNEFLSYDVDEMEMEVFRKHERTGRPLGGDSFVGKLEEMLGRNLKLKKTVPKKKEK